MHNPEQIYRLQKAGLAWLVAYLAFVAFTVWLVYEVRSRTLESLDTAEARADWEAWRTAAAEQSLGGPVQRRTPASQEPPALVLMRDYFGLVLGAAIVFGSALFATFMVALRGAFGRGRITILPKENYPRPRRPTNDA